LKWLDRKGNELGLLGDPGPWAFNRISPDGRRVATYRVGGGLWLLDTSRGVASLLTSPGGLYPIWSPDGRTILFNGPSGINRVSADGADREEPVAQPTNRQFATDWSRDGRFVIYTEEAQEQGRDLWVFPVTPDGRLEPGAKPRPFIREPLDQHGARFSPDTRWVAYQSNESGQWEVYVRSFPEARGKLLISTAGGDNPQWVAGGHELFYRSREGKLMVVTLKSSETSLDASLPRELFTLPPSLPGPTPYEVTADGQRFLVSDVAATSEPLNVIVNWPALLKKGAPAP
jgi:Tol biopolymer transport system component